MAGCIDAFVARFRCLWDHLGGGLTLKLLRKVLVALKTTIGNLNRMERLGLIGWGVESVNRLVHEGGDQGVAKWSFGCCYCWLMPFSALLDMSMSVLFWFVWG